MVFTREKLSEKKIYSPSAGKNPKTLMECFMGFDDTSNIVVHLQLFGIN